MRRATGPAALLIAALLAFAATATARAQLSIGMGAEASPVLSNKDFAAVLEDVAMDDAQRQVAFAAFDDAQDRMFDAAHAANAVRRRVGDSHDEQRLDLREVQREVRADVAPPQREQARLLDRQRVVRVAVRHPRGR